MYSITIQAALFDAADYPDHPEPSRFMVNGHVASTKEKSYRSAITIIVEIPNLDPITVVTDRPTLPPDGEDLPADFSFFGSIPGHEKVIPKGAKVTVYCNDLKHDTKEIVVVGGK